jgi:hypothetical protein
MVVRKSLLLLLVMFFGGVVGAKGEQIFTHNFDMAGNYNQFLISSTNAMVRTEGGWDSGGFTRYWCPTQSGVEGRVIYGYNVGFPIEHATIDANMFNFSEYGGAPVQLDISPDDVHWTNVASSWFQAPWDPIDITSILKDSQTAYVRARLFSTNGSPGAQFLRTYYDPWGRWPYMATPYVYNFSASSVPEPSTVVSLAGLVGVGLAWQVRRWRRA